MPTPSDFKLDPKLAHMAPQPAPPNVLKPQLYTDVSVFQAIDKHAVNEAKTNYRRFKDLIWNLVYKKNFTMLEKARIIFRWMTKKNMYTIMFDSELPGSPENVLSEFKDGKTTYARIFECLCSYAGLYCVTLSGWAKGVDYRPGQPLCSTPVNHSWNAVYIDGNWQLVDCHWATRYLQSEKNTPENLVYEYDDFYFLPEPASLVYSHCPEEPQWQLLKVVRPKTVFEEYPLVKSYFFTVGMQFLQQNQGVVYTTKGLITLTLGFEKSAAFTFKLSYGDGQKEFIQGINLKRYVIQETTKGKVTFYIRAPREGNYWLTIFSQQVGDRVRIENIFKAACEYKIVCDQGAADTRPYPECNDSNWGPGAPVHQYGLIPCQETAIVTAPNGRAEVQFIKTRDVRTYARLARDGFDDDTLERSLTLREQDDRVIITTNLPARGEYGLEIYANEPDREGDTFTHMCQYLVSFIDGDFGSKYGQVFDRSDLHASAQAKPMMYNVPASQYAQMTPDQLRQVPAGSNMQPLTQQQYAQFTSAPGQGGPGGQYQGGPGQYGGQGPYGSMGRGPQYQQGPDGQNSMGRGPQYQQGPDGQQYGQPQYAQYQGKPGGGPPGQQQYAYQPGQAGPGQYGGGQYMTGPGDSARMGPGGKQAYTGAAGYQDPNGEMSSRMEQVSVGGKKLPPGTSPKPGGQGRYGDEFPPPPPDMMSSQGRGGPDEQDFPPPPPEMMDHKNTDDSKRAPPVEIVYVSSNDAKQSPRTGRKIMQDDSGRKGVEVSYVTGDVNKASPPAVKKKPPGTAPKPVLGGASKSASNSSLSSATSLDEDKARRNQQPVTKGDLARQEALAGSRKPPGATDEGYQGSYDFPPPPPESAETRHIPVQVGDRANAGRKDPKFTSYATYQRNYPLGGGVKIEEDAGFGPQRPTEPEEEYKPHNPKTYTTSLQFEPPKDFTPQLVQPQAAPKPAPPQVPPKPFKDTGVFQNVDTHAVEVSKLEHRTFRDLVWHLIYAREITNELEKARAIFLWLCTKNLADLKFDQVVKGSPEEILVNLKNGQTTYATVYETLCSYAGLHCKTLNGYAKGAEYKPGMKFTGDQGRHSYNAVLVNGAWRLVDCHWAARRLVGKKVTAENVHYELDEYYFMPDPHQLIFTHFPEDENWQLIERPISLGDFENLVPVKSAFFKYGLQILSHKEAVISTAREVTILIGYPPLKTQSLAFTFTLTYEDGREEYKGTKLNRFGMHEMVDNVAFFTIRPPENEAYRLILYAKDLSQQTKEGVYGGVCEYELLCKNSTTRPQPFPPCVHTSWGLGDSAHKYNIVPLQKGAIFSTVQGQAEVKFRLPKELRFTAKLKSNTQDEKALQGYIMHRIVDEVAYFTVSAPNKGEFGLEIYANDPELDGNSLYHAFQYLIICTEDVGPVEPLPLLQPGYLGPQPLYKKLFLKTVTNNDPYIQTEIGDLEIAFTMEEPLRMTSQLIFVSGGSNEDRSDYILQQGKDKTVYFNLRLSKTGLYKLQIYGLPYSDTSESLPGAYNYLINCRATQSPPTGFPKQYGQWKEGCYLYEPTEGKLTPNLPSKGSANSYQYINYKMSVPKANSVAVVIGEEWTHLEKKDGKNWEGEVFVEKHWGKDTKASVCANYGSVKASYSTLLEYSM